MRARLLDMGEVSAARSQSIYHAIAATMDPEDDPVAILLRSASSLVSIGADRDPTFEIDLELCLAERIPVLRRLLGGPATLVGGDLLLFNFLLPEKRTADLPQLTPAPLAATCRSLGLPSRLGPSGEVLVGAGSQSRQVGTSQLGTFGGTSCLVTSLAHDPEPREPHSILRLRRDGEVRDYTPSSLTRELEERPDFADVAELLIEAVELEFGVELIPSMPTPDEMDAIYEWDEHLVFDLEPAASAANRNTAIH